MTRSDWGRTAPPTNRSSSSRRYAQSRTSWSCDRRARPTPWRRGAAVGGRVAGEAAVAQPWSGWVGERGVILGIERFGASAPYQGIYRELGLTVDHVGRQAKALLG